MISRKIVFSVVAAAGTPNETYCGRARTVEPEKQPLLANGSETTFVSGQRSQTNRFPRQQSTRNSGGVVGNCVFYGGPCRGVIRMTNGARIEHLEGSMPFKEDSSNEAED
jgi:hypothetical protein